MPLVQNMHDGSGLSGTQGQQVSHRCVLQEEGIPLTLFTEWHTRSDCLARARGRFNPKLEESASLRLHT